MDLAAEDPDFLTRFMKEGQLAGQLNHKNIVRIYDAGMEGNNAFIAMEFIEGCDTLELLQSRGALPPEEVLALAIGVAEALQEAHSLGIIHRDIKPDNILATNDGKIKLADLGLAKQINDDFGSTMAGTALGTPYYISPEQALDAMKADARSDIYSLGATLYHLLSGFLPYEGDNVMGVMLRHANEPLIPPQEKCPGLPESFCRLICKMMEKDPEKRYQNCSELLEDLLKLKYGNEDVAMAENAEEGGKLTSSKSVRVKVKIPAGKYAHKNPIKTKRDLKKRPPSQQKTKSNSKIIYAVVAALILAVSSIFIFKKGSDSPESDKVPDITNKDKEKQKQSIAKEQVKVSQPKETVKQVVEEIKPVPSPVESSSINFLEGEGKSHLKFIKPEMFSFDKGHMIINGKSEVNAKILASREKFSNFKLDIEFKWLSPKSDSGIDILVDNHKFYEINIANSWAATGILHGRGSSFNVDGVRQWHYKPDKKLTTAMNVWHKVQIVFKSGNLTVSANDVQLYSFDQLKLTEGKIRMSIWKNLGMEIRKFTLRPIKEAN